jgi:hypothetical protein
MWEHFSQVVVVSILDGSPEFNYFFTLVSVFGFCGYAVSLLVRLGSRS